MVDQPWNKIVDLPVPGRAAKPRHQGLTMVIDKGVGLVAMEDLLRMAGGAIDLWKLGFGTSALYDERTLKGKFALAKRYGVHIYPGGTLLEVAVMQGKHRDFLERAKELGFDYVEVSEGTIDLDPLQRCALIEAGVALGFGVVSEIGKKMKGQPLDPVHVGRQARADLESGAQWVIMEGRDSGRGVGIYEDDGAVRTSVLRNLADAVPDPDSIIWEAPQTNQQQELILEFGSKVNLGNVQPEDVITLEATRVGLRGDTLRLVWESGARST